MYSPCNVLKNIKNQQRSFDLSLVNEKIRLSKGSSTTNFRHAYIMDYPTKKDLRNYEFSVQRPSLKSVIQIRNLKMKNILFINKSFSSLLPLIFKSWFTFCYDAHNYQTVSSTTDKMFKPSYRTNSYGKSSITIGNL